LREVRGSGEKPECEGRSGGRGKKVRVAWKCWWLRGGRGTYEGSDIEDVILDGLGAVDGELLLLHLHLLLLKNTEEESVRQGLVRGTCFATTSTTNLTTCTPPCGGGGRTNTSGQRWDVATQCRHKRKKQGQAASSFHIDIKPGFNLIDTKVQNGGG
jgi:hypothetical protein